MKRVFLIALVLLAVGCTKDEYNIEIQKDLITATESAVEADCPDGGVIVYYGFDDNNDGQLSVNERVGEPSIICNGADGVDGQDGADGIDGVDGIDGQDGTDGLSFDPSLLTSTLEFFEGADPLGTTDCENGGAVVGVFYDGEQFSEFTVCNGIDGVDGEDGSDGVDGQDGQDGSDGEDGEDYYGEGITTEYIDPCPDTYAAHREYIVRVSYYGEAEYYAVYKSGNKVFWTQLEYGVNYRTTDGRNCRFTLEDIEDEYGDYYDEYDD